MFEGVLAPQSRLVLNSNGLNGLTLAGVGFTACPVGFDPVQSRAMDGFSIHEK